MSLKNLSLISIVFFISSMLLGCRISDDKDPECQAKLDSAQNSLAQKEYGLYLSMRNEFLAACNRYGVDSTLTSKSISLDNSISNDMQNSHQYLYFVDRERLNFLSGSSRDYNAYMSKQYDWFASHADYIKATDKRKAIDVMTGYESEVIRYFRQLGTAHATYYLAKSYVKRYSLGDNSAALLQQFSEALDLTPFATQEMYSNAMSLARDNKNQKLEQHFARQEVELNRGWGATPQQSRMYPIDKEKLVRVAESLDEKQSQKLKNSTLELAGLRDKVDIENQQFAARQVEIQAEQARANAEYEKQKNVENQQTIASLTGIASSAVIAQASGGNVMQAVNSSAADAVAAQSNDPELMQTIKSGFTSLTDSQHQECNLSTTSGFKACCKSNGGKLFTTPRPEGEVSYACRQSQRGKFGCMYKGSTRTGQCAMESE